MTVDETAAKGSMYGYGGRIDSIRANEFRHLDEDGVAYCDHAGAPPHSSALVREALTTLESTLLGNPHSAHDAGATTRSLIDEARDATLTHLNAPIGEYAVVFTSGATGAVRLLAEGFPWSSASEFAYTRGNHTSVVGARGCAAAAGAKVSVVDVVATDRDDDDENEHSWRVARTLEIVPESAGVYGPVNDDDDDDDTLVNDCESGDGAESLFRTHCLFAYGAECNLTGERRSPRVASTFIDGEGGHGGESTRRWWTLCDAAKAAALAPPDLGAPNAPDFVALSYYKIFGYPSGVGALVARRSALALLRPAYFGGGVAAGVDACEDFFARRRGPEGLEDGTLPFSAIACIPAGFRTIARLAGETSTSSREGSERADVHAYAVAEHCAARLSALRHDNGAPVTVLYGGGWAEVARSVGGACVSGHGPTVSGQGPTVAFNVLKDDGAHVGYVAVDRACAARGVHIRTGCCCNPGACDYFTRTPNVGGPATSGPGRARALHAAGKVCGDGVDVDEHGAPTGVCRASFGWCSTIADADALVSVITENFVSKPTADAPGIVSEGGAEGADTAVRIASLHVYPLKSASSFDPPGGTWPLGPNGLMFDREFALVSPSGVVMQQRNCPRLVKLVPSIDVDAGVMRVVVSGEPELGTCEVGLGLDVMNGGELGAGCTMGECKGVNVRLCGEDTVVGMHSGGRGSGSMNDDAIDAWFTRAVRAPCSLVRQRAGTRRSVAKGFRGDPNPSPDVLGVDETHAIGLANSAQILLVSAASVGHLQGLVDARRHAERGDNDDDTLPRVVVRPSRFRPNVVVEGSVDVEGGPAPALAPYEEEGVAWRSLELVSHLPDDSTAAGSNPRRVTKLAAVRRCERCSMVGIEQANGERTPEPMLSLAAFRNQSRKNATATDAANGTEGARGGGGGFTFGVLFNVDDASGTGRGFLSVGDVVRAVGCGAASPAC